MSISASKRFMVGGIGGLAPVFVLLLAFDYEKNFVNTNTAQTLGYLVRALALFAIGGFVSWLHESETHLFKLFEVGVGAPALLAGLITTHSIAPQTKPETVQAAVASVVETVFMIPSAHAQTTRMPALKEFRPRVAQPRDEFLEGLLGINAPNNYYVVTGSFTDYEKARKEAVRINSSGNSIKADVYAPFRSNPYYAVVIGENLSRTDATDLRAKAVQSGLPKSTYVLSAVPAPAK